MTTPHRSEPTRSPRERPLPRADHDPDDVRWIWIPPEGKSMQRIEKEAIVHTLALTGGNRSATSRILGISRPTLLRKIRRHRLQR